MKVYEKALISFVALSAATVFGASFQAIGLPPAGSKIIGGISANYTIVGGSGSSNWVWADGIYSIIVDVPIAIKDISDDGSVMIAGDAPLLGNPIYKVLNGITQIIPGYAQNTSATVYAVSDDGSKIVGDTRSGAAWVYENGSYTTLPLAGYISGGAYAISSNGSVIGGRIGNGITGEYYAVFWKDEGIEILPNSENSKIVVPKKISGDGSTLVGRYKDQANVDHACVWRNGTVEVLPMLAGVVSSEVIAVSYDGTLAFGNFFYNGWSAFVWDELNGTRLLKDFLENDYGLDLTGWNLLSVSATDASGNIITGYGINPQGQEELWIATIPEPGTIILFVVGGLMLQRKRI